MQESQRKYFLRKLDAFAGKPRGADDCLRGLFLLRGARAQFSL
jgi:hypothetical protein